MPENHVLHQTQSDMRNKLIQVGGFWYFFFLTVCKATSFVFAILMNFVPLVFFFCIWNKTHAGQSENELIVYWPQCNTIFFLF